MMLFFLFTHQCLDFSVSWINQLHKEMCRQNNNNKKTNKHVCDYFLCLLHVCNYFS